jgi:hypothetical protein
MRELLLHQMLHTSVKLGLPVWRTEFEGIREWGDEEDIIIKHGGSERRLLKFT